MSCAWCVEVISVQVHYVRPSPCDDIGSESDSVLTEECRIQTNLPEDAIRNAQPLELVVDEVGQSVSQLTVLQLCRLIPRLISIGYCLYVLCNCLASTDQT